jgi:signal transduction histidine kinase
VKGPYLVVRHVVGGTLRGAAVEAIAPTASLRAAQYQLAGSLGLIGLVVIPLAALGGRLLARRALRPIDGLVGRIRALDSSRLGDRLALPEGAVQEVAVLASAFDDLLGRLQTSVETMRRFTADASHEIRNPLSVLRTGLEVALRRPRQNEEYRTLIQENLRELERLQAVLEGLLVLARDVPGTEYPLARVPVDFSHLIEQTADGFGTVAAERGIRIEEAIDPALQVEGDPQLLRLVVFNLLDNALKYSPSGETVRLEASAGDTEVTLLVADRGPGVAPEDRERLFGRFFRAEPASRPGVGGLGLSVVLWVTELHGGKVRLLDTDQGAAFEVTLPAATPSRKPATSRDAA